MRGFAPKSSGGALRSDIKAALYQSALPAALASVGPLEAKALFQGQITGEAGAHQANMLI